MLTFLLLLAALAYFSQRTNPTLEHFRAHLTALGRDRLPDGTPPAQAGVSASTRTASGAATKVGRFFQRLATATTPAPDIVYESYQVCSIATVRYVTGAEATYLGWFGSWWLLSEVRVKGSGAATLVGRGSNDRSDDELDKAEELKQTAVTLKGERAYVRAARAYEAAGKAFSQVASTSKSDAQLAAHEAGGCYEEAYRCFRQAPDGSRMADHQAQSLEHAVNCFLRCGTSGESRAAGLLCKLAELECAQVSSEEERAGASPGGLRAAQIYQRAAHLYEQAGDGRHVYTKLREAETAARFGHYTHGVHAYDQAMDVLRHREMDRLVLPQYLFAAGLCWMAVGAWGRLDGHIAKAIDMLPTFEGSPQCVLLQTLYECAVVGEADRFNATRATFAARTHLEPWQLRALNAAAATVDIEELR
ncbi:soluble NSF attachment protein [Thamnocephalis sphaerospora]|uniref:Gamma-soluble NSF attachment protein n=1 Tax=Thamnocephalis sphaerospora TaxID=78915 RepID=A0A4P9XQ76_9FUNG|nr:soluble NSF attachment protein [Thamnocephalis sphaerospora]|eukprot:RKP08176.1 soluble NSF attachment protein [Thamnocephalis sphaerospora]